MKKRPADDEVIKEANQMIEHRFRLRTAENQN